MTVIIAEQTPPKVRGLLKRWFIEPKPNVFVGTVNSRTRDKVLQYILKHATEDLGLLIIADNHSSQGFSVTSCRQTSRIGTIRSGHFLIAEKWDECKDEESSVINEDPSEITPEKFEKIKEIINSVGIDYQVKS